MFTHLEPTCYKRQSLPYFSITWRMNLSQARSNITEEDGRKFKNIYIDLILKIILFLVFT